MFILMDGAMDAGLIEESQGVFLCSTKSHMPRNCNQTAICEASNRALPSVPAVDVWHPTVPDLVCVGLLFRKCCQFFFLEKCILILFLHTYMGIKMSHHCKYVYYTQSIRFKRFFLFDTVMLCVNIYRFILKSKVMLPFFILIAFRSKYGHIP